MNYAKFDTQTTIDSNQTQGTFNCSNSRPCLLLHNGARLQLGDKSFGGTGVTNALFFDLDPDGVVTDGTTNGPGKAVEFNLYYGGRLTTWGTCLPNTIDSGGGTWGPNPALDPPWFGWN